MSNRGVLGRVVRRLVRNSGRSAPETAQEVLKFHIVDDRALVELRIAAHAGVPELHVQSRSGVLIAQYIQPASRGALWSVSIDLAELVRTHGLRETANLYLTWERTTKAGWHEDRSTAARRLRRDGAAARRRSGR